MHRIQIYVCMCLVWHVKTCQESPNQSHKSRDPQPWTNKVPSRTVQRPPALSVPSWNPPATGTPRFSTLSFEFWALVQVRGSTSDEKSERWYWWFRAVGNNCKPRSMLIGGRATQLFFSCTIEEHIKYTYNICIHMYELAAICYPLNTCMICKSDAESKVAHSCFSFQCLVFLTECDWPIRTAIYRISKKCCFGFLNLLTLTLDPGAFNMNCKHHQPVLTSQWNNSHKDASHCRPCGIAFSRSYYFQFQNEFMSNFNLMVNVYIPILEHTESDSSLTWLCKRLRIAFWNWSAWNCQSQEHLRLNPNHPRDTLNKPHMFDCN